MRNLRATHNKIAVSANNRETAINTSRDTDTIILSNLSDIINLEPRKEDNADQRLGKEEADQIYNLGNTASLTLNFDRAQPQHFAFGLGYALGNVSTVQESTSYIHTITPINGEIDYQRSNPSFSALMQYGDTIFSRLFSSFFVDSATASFSQDEWCKLKLDIKGTGNFEDDMNEILIEAEDSSLIRIDSPPYAVGDSGNVFDSIHRIQARLLTEDRWHEVIFHTASKAGGKTIINIDAPNITVPGLGTLIQYKILYRAESSFVWPENIVHESPLRVSDVNVILGGRWDGTNFYGGIPLNSDLNSLEYTINNNLKFDFGFNAPGGYANRVFREGRDQTISFDRDFKDYILQQSCFNNDYFGLKIKATGAEIDSNNNYHVELIFPRLAILNAPISVENKIVAEKGDMKVLGSDDYPSVIVKVQNIVENYVS